MNRKICPFPIRDSAISPSPAGERASVGKPYLADGLGSPRRPEIADKQGYFYIVLLRITIHTACVFILTRPSIFFYISSNKTLIIVPPPITSLLHSYYLLLAFTHCPLAWPSHRRR